MVTECLRLGQCTRRYLAQATAMGETRNCGGLTPANTATDAPYTNVCGVHTFC